MGRASTDRTNPFVHEGIGKLGPVPFNKVARTLSAFLGRRLEIGEFKSVVLDGADLVTALGLDRDAYYFGAFSKLHSGIDAYVLILMPPDQITGLLFSLTGRASRILDDYQGSALQEFANMILGSLSSAMANEFGIRIEYSIPTMAIDSLQAISDALLARLSELGRVAYMEGGIRSDPPLDIRIMFFFSA